MEKKIIEDLHAGKLAHYIKRYRRDESYKYDPSFELCNSKDNIVLNDAPYYPAAVDPEYARRILACMDYCTGISTEELEKQIKLMGVL